MRRSEQKAAPAQRMRSRLASRDYRYDTDSTLTGTHWRPEQRGAEGCSEWIRMCLISCMKRTMRMGRSAGNNRDFGARTWQRPLSTFRCGGSGHTKFTQFFPQIFRRPVRRGWRGSPRRRPGHSTNRTGATARWWRFRRGGRGDAGLVTTAFATLTMRFLKRKWACRNSISNSKPAERHPTVISHSFSNFSTISLLDIDFMKLTISKT